jgi:hypothetical protein
MGTLDKIGLGRKMRGAGYLGDKRKEDPFIIGKNGYVKAVILLVFFIGLIVFYPGGLFQDVVYKVGEPWRDDDLIAPFTFALLKSPAETQAEIAEIAASTAPIFTQKVGVNEAVQQRLDSLFIQTVRVLDLYATYRMSQLAGSASLADSDSLRYMQERAAVTPVFDDRSWSILTNQYAFLRIAEASRSRASSERFIGVDVRIRTEFLIAELFAEGVIDTHEQARGCLGDIVIEGRAIAVFVVALPPHMPAALALRDLPSFDQLAVEVDVGDVVPTRLLRRAGLVGGENRFSAVHHSETRRPDRTGDDAARRPGNVGNLRGGFGPAAALVSHDAPRRSGKRTRLHHRRRRAAPLLGIHPGGQRRASLNRCRPPTRYSC